MNFNREKVQKYEKKWKSKNDFSGPEISLKNDGHKRPLLEVQIEESSQNKFYRKKGFLAQKYEKKWKSKNDLKSRLRALNKELWAIYVFFTNLKFDDCQKYKRKPAKI